MCIPEDLSPLDYHIRLLKPWLYLAEKLKSVFKRGRSLLVESIASSISAIPMARTVVDKLETDGKPGISFLAVCQVSVIESGIWASQKLTAGSLQDLLELQDPRTLQYLFIFGSYFKPTALCYSQ